MSQLDPNAVAAAERAWRLIEAQTGGEPDADLLPTMALSLCVLGAKQGKGPDELAALVVGLWPAAALAVIEEGQQQ